jgi:predicted RNA binding protein with dsRBD fold (UPF0201 family)
VFYPWAADARHVKTAGMQRDISFEGLPDAAERRRISEQARKSLSDALALSERLDRWERQAAGIGRVNAAAEEPLSCFSAHPPSAG